MTNTHNLIIQFGKWKGERWTRVPVSYLRWLVNQPDSTEVRIAKAELERRGTILEHEIQITPHAIDRASLRCIRQWKEMRLDNEGLYAWLHRVASTALQEAASKSEELEFRGMKLVFKHGELDTTLISVMLAKEAA